jgi:hypothetical protein
MIVAVVKEDQLHHQLASAALGKVWLLLLDCCNPASTNSSSNTHNSCCCCWTLDCNAVVGLVDCDDDVGGLLC